MRARAPVAGGGLGHVGGEEALLLGDLLQQHAQEHQAVGHADEIRVAEIQLELRVGALADHILQSPAEVFEDVDDRAEEPHGIDGVLDVVAEGLASRPHAFVGERVVVEGLDRLAVAPAHHDELGLDARETHKALGRGVADHALQRLAGAEVVGRILPPEVGKHPGAGAIPRADDKGVEVRYRNLVGVRCAELGHEGDRVHGELRPPAHAQVLEVADRHRLGLGQAVHVDPAGKDVADSRLEEPRLLLTDVFDVGQRLGEGSWCYNHWMFASLCTKGRNCRFSW